jgi:hypothetical protein
MDAAGIDVQLLSLNKPGTEEIERMLPKVIPPQQCSNFAAR